MTKTHWIIFEDISHPLKPIVSSRKVPKLEMYSAIFRIGQVELLNDAFYRIREKEVLNGNLIIGLWPLKEKVSKLFSQFDDQLKHH